MNKFQLIFFLCLFQIRPTIKNYHCEPEYQLNFHQFTDCRNEGLTHLIFFSPNGRFLIEFSLLCMCYVFQMSNQQPNGPNIFFETFGATKLSTHDWELSTDNFGAQIVIINDQNQRFRLELFSRSKVSLTSTRRMKRRVVWTRSCSCHLYFAHFVHT